MNAHCRNKMIKYKNSQQTNLNRVFVQDTNLVIIRYNLLFNQQYFSWLLSSARLTTFQQQPFQTFVSFVFFRSINSGWNSEIGSLLQNCPTSPGIQVPIVQIFYEASKKKDLRSGRNQSGKLKWLGQKLLRKRWNLL